MTDFFQYLVNGLTIGTFLALIALGYSMVYGVLRLINFAHGDVFMVGSFAGLAVLSGVSSSSPMTALAIVGAVLAGSLVSGLLGVGIMRVAYAPLLRAPKISLLIGAIGVSFALEEAVKLLTHAGFRSYPHVLPQTMLLSGPVRISYSQVVLVVLAVGLMFGLWAFITRTVRGTAMRALAMDGDAARLMGIDVERVVLTTFFIGSVLAGTAGVMYGLYYSQINFAVGFLVGLRAFTAAVLGGIGNMVGAAVAGILIGLVQSFAAGYVSSRWADVIIFGVLIGALVLRPQGLFGERVAERV